MKQRFKKFFQGKQSEDETKHLINRRLILLLAIIGVILIFLSKLFVKDEKTTEKINLPQSVEQETKVLDDHQIENETIIIHEIERSYEKHLENMLNQMTGVSEAEVMVNLDSTNINIYAKNNSHGQQTTDETDRNGGERRVQDQTEESQVVLTRQGDQEVPLLIQTKKPAVRGVFIVAKGVDHGHVKLSVIDAVSKVLDVSTHKISVMPKN